MSVTRSQFTLIALMFAIILGAIAWSEPSHAQASKVWKVAYETFIGKQCPKDNNKGFDKHGYSWCQCTSYAAFRVANAGGVGFTGLGHAGSWHNKVRSVDRAVKGAVLEIVYKNGGGHVAYIDDVVNGKMILTDYNGSKQGDWNTFSLGTDKRSIENHWKRENGGVKSYRFLSFRR